jgi:hypothetical protein
MAKDIKIKEVMRVNPKHITANDRHMLAYFVEKPGRRKIEATKNGYLYTLDAYKKNASVNIEPALSRSFHAILWLAQLSGYKAISFDEKAKISNFINLAPGETK